MYEPAARVPMVLTGPGIAPREIRTVTSLFDVYPTVMELMGLSALTPSDVAGGSIVPWHGTSAGEPEPSSAICRSRLAVGVRGPWGERARS